MRVSRYAYLAFLAFLAPSAFVAAKCEFKDPNQQKQCMQQEQARQQAEAKQQQQQQAQQQRQQMEAQQRADQERQRQAEAARKQQEQARQAASPTARMTPVTLGNGQQVFVDSQGAFFDGKGNPVSNQSVAAAKKGTPAITPAPSNQEQQRAQELQRQQAESQRQQQETQQRADQERQRQAEAARKQQEQARQAELERKRKDEETRKLQEVAKQQAPQQIKSAPAQATTQANLPTPTPTSSKPALTTSGASHTAGLTPVTLGNGQQVFVNPQGVYSDANGNQISSQSVATAKAGTPTIRVTPAVTTGSAPIQEIGTHRGNSGIASSPNMPAAAPSVSGKLVVSPPSTQTANSTPASITTSPTTPMTNRPTSVQEVGTHRAIAQTAPPSTQELQKYGVDQLASMPKEQLINLSPDQRQHLTNYISGKASVAKYDAEAKRYKAIEQTLAPLEKPAQFGLGAAELTTGAVVGTGEKSFEITKGAVTTLQAVGTPIRDAVGTLARDATYNPKAISSDIQGGATKVLQEGKQLGQSLPQLPMAVVSGIANDAASGTANVISAAKQENMFEVGRASAKTAVTVGTAVIPVLDDAAGLKALSEGGAVLRGVERKALRKEVATGARVGTIDRAATGIQWGKGIQAQGMPWENYLARQMPAGSRTPPNFKTFDFFNDATGVATSAKTLDTTTAAKLTNPAQIYSSLRGDIDAAAKFKEYTLSGRTISADQISVRELRVAIPANTTPAQWEQIDKAIRYGQNQGVKVVVTPIK